MSDNHTPRTLRRRAGFSLVELMIAVFLGALVVAGLINVLMANRQAYHIQEANNFNQENMRFAMDRMGWSLRMADFWGGVKPADITGAPAVIAAGACDKTWVLDVDDSVYGYDGNGATSTFPLNNCVNNNNYISGTDVLVVRYAGTDAVPTSGGTNGINAGEVYLQAQTGGHGELFEGTVPADLPNSTQGVSTYPYAVEMYYLRPCSDPGAGGICGPTSDGGNPIPTLMRLRLQANHTLINEPVVEGVEQLQFEYGIGTAGDSTPTRYENATAATAANDWPNVTAVRIGYVLRSQTRDTRLPHTFDSNSTTTTDATFPIRISSDCQYGIKADGSAEYGPTKCPNFSGTGDPVSNKPQQFVRTEMTSVVQVRNRVRQ